MLICQSALSARNSPVSSGNSDKRDSFANCARLESSRMMLLFVAPLASHMQAASWKPTQDVTGAPAQMVRSHLQTVPAFPAQFVIQAPFCTEVDCPKVIHTLSAYQVTNHFQSRHHSYKVCPHVPPAISFHHCAYRQSTDAAMHASFGLVHRGLWQREHARRTARRVLLDLLQH